MLIISNLLLMEVYISIDVFRFLDGILCVIVDYFRFFIGRLKILFLYNLLNLK